MDPVVHFEMPYVDGARIARFYEQAFGWKLQKLGPEMGHYILATTAQPYPEPVRHSALTTGPDAP